MKTRGVAPLAASATNATTPAATGSLHPGASLREVERQHILATLEQCGGDKRKTAQLLGISLKTLYNRLNQYAGI